MLNLIPLPYKIIGGATAAIALIGGTYFYGYTKGTAKAEAELMAFAARSSQQIAELQERNAELSNNVQIQYVDRVNTIREKEYVYRDIAENRVAPKCELSNGWVHVHDASTGAGDANTTRAADETPSGITDTQALVGIVGNYSRCQQNAQQLALLQKWILENKHLADKAAEEAKND